MQFSSKTLLSVVASTMLAGSLYADGAATYLPLTSDTHDNAWVMFGVNAFSTGVSSETALSISETLNPSYEMIMDVGTDKAATVGFPDIGGINLGALQSLQDSNNVDYFSVVYAAVQSNDLTYTATSQVRTMYVRFGDDPAAKVKVVYNALLEGRVIEFQLPSDTKIYRTFISQAATWNNPAHAVTGGNLAPSTDPVLTKVDDVLAYALSTSPIMAYAYDKSKHQYRASVGGAEGRQRFYNFDTANQQWDVWDRANTSNPALLDFTDFTVGKAYWGRFDHDTTSNTDNIASRGGLVLGRTNRTTADATVYTGKLSEGWNMLAFDPAQNPDIRNAASGLVLAVNAPANTNTIDIYDETGVNHVTVTFTAASVVNTTTLARHINATIETAKILGNVPQSFNIKAFGDGATNTNVIMLSDKRFTVADNNDVFGAALTLANEDPLLKGANDALMAITPITDVGSTANTDVATSVYGEFSIIFEPMVGATSAADLDDLAVALGTGRSAAVQFGTRAGESKNGNTTPTPVYLTLDTTASTLTTAVDNLKLDDVFDGGVGTGRILQIDTDFDGTNDMLLAASNKAFYLRDNTYVRVYEVTTGGTGDIDVAGKTVSLLNTDNLAGIVTKINAIADTATPANNSGVYAKANGTKIITVSTQSRTYDLEDAESATVNFFKSAQSTDAAAKGAVARVVEVAKLARQSVISNKFVIDFGNIDSLGLDAGDFSGDEDTPDGNSDTAISVVVSGGTVTAATHQLTAGVYATDTARIAILDALVTKINTALKTSGVAAFASHNYINGLDDITLAKITIEGVGIISASLNSDDDGFEGVGANSAFALSETATNPGTLAIPTITDDLKDNAIYTPDYANYGPLYTLKEAGYEAISMLHPSTNIAAIPSTHWDHIDLTRDTDEWFINNEFNLFTVDNAAGYWVYLEPYTVPQTPIVFTNPIYTPYYQYHFYDDGDADATVDKTENHIDSGMFNIQISGIDDATSNVELTIDGNLVRMTKQSDGSYGAHLTSYETSGITSGQNIPVSIRATNGKGDAAIQEAVITVDFQAPAVPTVTFANATKATIASTSNDVASYYVYENFIPDNGDSPVGRQLTAAQASAFNLCSTSSFASTTTYLAVAVDGTTGEFGAANISNARKFSYVNTAKSANMITHTFGEATSNTTEYDITCTVVSTTPDARLTKGVDVRALGAGTVRASFAEIDNTDLTNITDLPHVAYFETANGIGASVRISYIPAYIGDTFYVEIGGALYTGTFPNEANADASFADAIDLTPVATTNQTLVVAN